MTDPAYEPTDVELNDGQRQLCITWGDGKITRQSYRYLRLACHCAGCVEEMTGNKLLDPSTVPEDLGVRDIEEVGAYGVRFRWTDGHGTGIYTWERLRKLEGQA